MDNRAYGLLCTLALLLVLASLPAHAPDRVENIMMRDETPRLSKLSVVAYEDHDPIVITSDADFAGQGWNGSGVEGDPYLIEGLNITTRFLGISVSDTTVYFEIKNCFISWEEQTNYDGIKLNNVTNGMIRDTIVENHHIGFVVWHSLGTILTNNTASSSNGHRGFHLFSSSNSTLTNNTASGNSYSGFDLEQSSNCTLTNNTASNNPGYAFNLYLSSNNTLTSNTASSNGYAGFRLSSSNNNILTNNTVSGNGWDGFTLSSSTNNTLTNNTLRGNGVIIHGGSVTHWIHDIADNTVNDRPLGYFKSVSDMVIDGDQYGQVILANCTRVTVRNGVFVNASPGVQLGFSTDCTLTNNTASSNGEWGFFLSYSTNNTLTNNTAFNNSRDGFYLYYSGSSTLTNNTATNCSSGFYLGHSESYTLTNNTATNNSMYGFILWSSVESTLTNNTANDNMYGILLTSDSSGNLVFLNILFNNTQSNGQDGGSSNSWDNGEHGNFWGDYDGSGTYLIPGGAGSVDNHPYVFGTVVDTTPPTIDSPADIDYEEGTTGHSITWDPEDQNPDSYTIYLNGTVVKSGVWNSSSDIITISVDGLSVGVYNYTLVVTDVGENSASDTVWVTVVDTTPPLIDNPEDIEYEEGTSGHSITWTPTDTNPLRYEVYRNGSLLEDGSWDGSEISIGVDDLAVGTYNYTIIVYDTSENSNSDTVFVTVFASTTTITETTTPTEPTTTTITETTTPTEPTIEPPVWEVVLLVGGAAAGVIVLVMIIIHFKKP